MWYPGSRMIVFDVDETLRPDRKPVSPDVAERLRIIGRMAEISLISGKDASFVLGLADGMGVDVSFVAGEVGGVIIEVPSHRQIVYPLSENLRKSLGRCAGKLKTAFGKLLWFQPNLVNVTVLPLGSLEVEEVLHFAESAICSEDGLYVSTHSGMVDIIPVSLSKGYFIEHLERGGYARESLAAVGDGENDIPMLSRAGFSITFESSLPAVKESADLVVSDIREALDVIERIARYSGRSA